MRSIPDRVCVALVAVTVSVGGLLAGAAPAQAAAAVSPLIWGENLVLEPDSMDSDWFLRSAELREGLAAAHTRIIRMPVRGSDPNTPGIVNTEELRQAAEYVKEMDVVPLVILRHPKNPALLEDDLEAVRLMNEVFDDPADVVYYEWANETDAEWDPDAVSASFYTETWNEIVPRLKSEATNDVRFIGPVTYHYNREYLETFLREADPRPDAVSWHEYTCGSDEDQAACLADIDRWTDHFADARGLMTEVLGAELPIWVTEWNYNPNINDGDDPDAGDPEFLHEWVTRAMRNLAENGVVGSMHYNVDNRVALVDDSGELEAQGRAFQEQYEALVG